jgi:ribosome-associated protein
MTETAAKKDIQKLQRLIVDALEDVKAQDLKVFDTEHLSPLFERVIIASGTSNRQTKALAASVRDKVREAGFGKPRIEGEDNGEWIIADCGAAVVHIMQPTIRMYYNLEEIWGDKPVRLKFGAPKPAVAETTEKKPAAKKAPAKKAAAGKTAAKAPAKKTSAKPAAKSASKPAAKTALKAPAKKTAPLKKVVVKAPAKTVAKAAAKKTTAAPRKLVKPATRKSS